MSSDFCESFPFNADANSKILILGSMPGVKSLEEAEYYAHPQNAFWEIMGEVFGVGRDLPYKQRLAKLLENDIALWDVAYQCERPGSLDTKIDMSTVVPNDFESLFKTSPGIKKIFFNGAKSEQLFRKLVLKDLQVDVEMLRLPSTSPAHASLSKQKKLEVWREAFKGLAPASGQ